MQQRFQWRMFVGYHPGDVVDGYIDTHRIREYIYPPVGNGIESGAVAADSVTIKQKTCI